MDDNYDPADNSAKSYALAIDTMREKLNSFRKEVIGDAVLYLGDCREILPLLPKVDAVVTDPPYGIGEDGGNCRARKKNKYINVLPKGGWDSETPDKIVFDLMRAKSDEQIVWGGNYFSDKLPPSRGWLYWQKKMGGDFSDGELAWTSRDRALREFTYCPKGGDVVSRFAKLAEHPTQKPIAVMQWCLSFVPDARTILDPFMGSGSTGVACARMGRRFIGIEIDAGYFETACKRISDAYAQPDFFVEAEKPKPAEQLDMLKGAAE